MNNITKILSISAAALALGSCDDFLNRSPYDELSSDTMFTSATLAESVVTGVYSNLLYDYNSTEVSVVNWDAFSSVIDPQESMVDLEYSYLMGTIQPNNKLFLTYWKRLYEGINRANDVISNILSVPDMSEDTKAVRIAEARFLRAYHYYRLNAYWRGVPIYETNMAPAEYVKPRESEEKVWRYIVDQCTEVIACEQLPDIYAASDGNYGRVTKGAAYTLRGKAYLWLKEWALAEADFKTVGECGYELYNGAYADLFTEANEKCKEMIFSVQMIDEKGQGNSFSEMYGNYCTTGYGKFRYYMNTDFIESYEEKDGKPFSWENYIPGYSDMAPKARSVYFLRNSMTEAEQTSMSTRGADMSKYDNSGNEARILKAYENRDPRLAAVAITPYSTYEGGASGAAVTYTSRHPYRDWQSPTCDISCGSNLYLLYPIRKFVTEGRQYTNIAHNPVDVPVFRYADVLLCLAEALNEQGKWSDAIPYVNKVRQRAGVALLNSGEPNLQVADSDMLRERIQKEKKWELACEEVVWVDELRWGTWKDSKFAEGNGLKAVWGDPLYTYKWGGNAFLKWAVPSSEVERAGLVQNEYWY